jgi:hypothetical protein
METLAQIVDQLNEIAEAEIPAPRTCRIRLYDDMTYRITIEHHYGDNTEAIVYDRNTGDVFWRDTVGAREFRFLQREAGGIACKPYFTEDAERVVTTIEPPLECTELDSECLGKRSPLIVE